MKAIQKLLVIWAVLAILAAPVGGVSAQTTGSQYFAQTGHFVSGDFYKFYISFTEPEFIFGYPITEAFNDPATGVLVQYFQRARFEYDAQSKMDSKVKLTAIGKALYTAGSPTLNLNNALACRSYTETGFSVCYAFLEFFNKYGGPTTFGYPISGFEIYNGRIVQYFERARFEWYPEYPEGQKVVLANLGRAYFDSIPEDAQRLAPIPKDNIPNSNAVLQLKARVFVLKAVALTTDQQMAYIVVQDQTLQAVPNATGVLTVKWAKSDPQTFPFTTNEKGVSLLTIPYTDQPYGSLITVTADVSYKTKDGKSLTARTTTSFRIWK